VERKIYHLECDLQFGGFEPWSHKKIFFLEKNPSFAERKDLNKFENNF
jgi:hypothetical protein